mgnify:CR=1 FL=1
MANKYTTEYKVQAVKLASLHGIQGLYERFTIRCSVFL